MVSSLHSAYRLANIEFISEKSAFSAGYTNAFNIGALMEKGVRLIGNGQAPVHLYWEEILNDYIIPGKFDPTL